MKKPQNDPRKKANDPRDAKPTIVDERNRKRSREELVDLVDEEGMESFPASDPPGRLKGGGRPEPHRPRNEDV